MPFFCGARWAYNVNTFEVLFPAGGFIPEGFISVGFNEASTHESCLENNHVITVDILCPVTFR